MGGESGYECERGKDENDSWEVRVEGGKIRVKGSKMSVGGRRELI